ncbi:hypothetical protein FN846DRAFT_228488 [Sphaerosporella brunnea]|uniref:NACHT domain-containing protein n=1 Tax=Sphaerosporella brunnea TaxID=1250544 RepID=A0A5J5ENZ5_9PEZI|nr:hypothetical protein FN846DRAFT_549844 [Sphaerosporella brunnea]KAA8897767.1 hypothetical protein FN846DRAFT_228488 [Sphaerosporella brunnea]
MNGTNYIHAQHNSFEGSTLNGGQHFHGSSGSSTPQSCLRSLYTSSYESHKGRNPPRVPGTLEWFLNHEKYRHWWHEQNSSLLWVSGDPGCGKSVLASFLVDQLNRLVSQSELPSTVCFFFFKDDNEEQKTATFALSALLHQLFKAKTSLIRHAMTEFEGKGEKFTKELGTLWRIFTAATTDPDCGNVICIVDGLDECEDLTRNEFIKSLVSIYTPADRTGRNLKFILTSRPYGSIESLFRKLPTIRLKAEDQTLAINTDIDLVINTEVEALGEKWNLPDDVRKDLRDKLVKRADQTFLWVSLILQILQDCPVASKSEFHEALNNLPPNLDAIYEKLLQDSCNPEKAKTILQIVIAAARPLTFDEMNIALAIQSDHKSIEDLESYRLYSAETVVKDICGLFVRAIDSKIYLIHQTAREFLIKEPTTTTPTTESSAWKHSLCPIESNLTLSMRCIYYLSFTVFETHPLVLTSVHRTRITEHEIDHYTRKHAFLDYAAKNWLYHVSEAKIWEKRELSGSALEVLDSASRRLLTWFLVYQTAHESSHAHPRNVTSLMVASYLGLDTAVKQLLENGADINGRDDLYGSALNAAAIREHDKVVKMLLENGAFVYLYGDECRNLLQVNRYL